MRLEILFSRILGTRVGILTPKNKKSFFSIAILLMFMLLVATPAFATHYLYVSKSGNDGTAVMDDPNYPWLTIQAAVNQVPSPLEEDTYIVQVQDSETYTENVNAWKSGSATDTFTIQAASGQEPTVDANVGTYGFTIGRYTTVDGFKITNAGSRGIDMGDNTHHNTIKNCTIYNNNGDYGGLYLNNSDYNTISNNIIHGNSTGIRIRGYSDSNTLKNNLIYNNTSAGVVVYDLSDDNSLINNTFYNNTKEIKISDYGGFSARTTLKNNIFSATGSGDHCIYVDQVLGTTFTISDYNNLYAPDGNVGYINGTSYSTLSAWRTASSQDGASISANPLFVTAGSNFHLDDYSPCIGAGTSSGAPTDDIEGNARGTPPDIGAYENSRDAPLPVTLSSFTVQFLNESPVLCWTTQSETNNAGWNIYRGETNEALSNEEAYLLNLSLGLIPGAGTTSEPTEYSFEDCFPVYPGTTYFYWLESMDYSGDTELYGPISLSIPAEEWQNPNSPEIPKPYGLHQNYPNPFNPSTEISFMLQENCIGELTIYNYKGQKIKTLFKNSPISRDELVITTWDGKDEFGKNIASGIYLYKMKAGKYSSAKKMILMK